MNAKSDEATRSNNWYFPKNVQPILAKLPKEKRPAALGTTGRAEAKGKCEEVAADAEQEMATFLKVPKFLSLKQTMEMALNSAQHAKVVFDG